MTAYVTEVCSDCGNLRSVCSDRSVAQYPQRSYCYAKAEVDAAWRRTWAKYGQPEGAAAHDTDGLKWWTSPDDLTPDDHFI